MEAYCERQGKAMASVRFLYDGERIQAHHTPAEVCQRILRILYMFRRMNE